MRVVFQREVPNLDDKNKKLRMVETLWKVQRAETLFESYFPKNEQIKKEVKNTLFEKMVGIFQKSKEYKQVMEGKSGIKTITNKDFVEATNGKIKLKINFRYILDYFGFFGSYKVYDVEADVFYIYDFERDKWIFEGIEILNTPIEKK